MRYSIFTLVPSDAPDAARVQIVSSSYTVAAYLQELGFGSSSGPHAGQKVLLLGSQGVEQELELHGVPYIAGSTLQLPLMQGPGPMRALQVDASIGAVVVGWDPSFSYSHLVYASICLRELPGCLFVATNTDSADNIGGGRYMPGTGALVAAVEVACGRRAFNVGKGGDWLFPFLCRRLGLQAARACVVGDRLDTDIALGRANGMRTILTLTGAPACGCMLQSAPVTCSMSELQSNQCRCDNAGGGRSRMRPGAARQSGAQRGCAWGHG